MGNTKNMRLLTHVWVQAPKPSKLLEIFDFIYEDPIWSENGTVCIYFGSPAGFPDSPSVTISAPALTNLGTTLRTIDVNSDGSLDLIIGCPYFQGVPGPQSGAVFIYYSSK